MYNWIVSDEDVGKRLGTFLKEKLKNSKTGDIRYSMDHHSCRVNDAIERFASRRLCARDKITFQLKEARRHFLEPHRILFEDEWLFVYDKPAQMTTETLQKLTSHFIVHRLDRDTTGALLFAKNITVQQLLEALFRKRLMKKSYLALVFGVMKKPSGTVENYLAPLKRRQGEVVMGVVDKKRGVWSKTHWRCLSQSEKGALVLAEPLTGRTHQVRVHLGHIGHPIVGDIRYGSRMQSASRPLLHASKLEFIHPITQANLVIEAPLPHDFQKKGNFREDKEEITGWAG